MLRIIALSAAIILTTLGTSGIAAAACDYPKKADLPDGRNASEQEMLDGQRAVKAYMASMDEYLACLDAENKAAMVEGEDPSITAKREGITAQRHNAAVDEMTQYAEAFNEQVRAFKDRDEK